MLVPLRNSKFLVHVRHNGKTLKQKGRKDKQLNLLCTYNRSSSLFGFWGLGNTEMLFTNAMNISLQDVY
jgi:hypothetical protein